MGDEGGYGNAAWGADEDDTRAERQFEAQKDATVFLIDTGRGMLAPAAVGKPEGWPDETPFRALDLAINLAQTTMRNKIICSESDLLAVCFFGTRELQNALNFAGVFTVKEEGSAALDVPTARRIQQLKNLPATFEQDVGCGDDQKEAALTHALWACSDLVQTALRGKLASAGSKRVILLTNDPQPLCAGSDGVRVVERAKLLEQMGVFVQVVPLCPSFEWSRFYARIHNDPDAAPEEPGFESSLDALRERIRRKTHKKRRLAGMELVCFPGSAAGLPGAPDAAPLRLSVALFSLVQRAKLPPASKVDRASHAPLRSMATALDMDTGMPLNLKDPTVAVRKALPYGPQGFKVIMPPADADAIKRGPGAVGLTLLGFKPLSQLRDDDNMRTPYFLYPDEAGRAGSTASFTALLHAMLRADVAAIALLVRAARSAPRLVALLPAQEVCLSGGAQVSPPGMHVVTLPFADDVRSSERIALPVPAVTAPEEIVALARNATELLRLVDFRCEDVDNPSLQKFYACLEHFALVSDDPVEDAVEQAPTRDDTLPDIEGFQSIGGEAAVSAFAAALDELAPPQDQPPPKGPPAKKRKAEADPELAEEQAAAVAKVVQLGADDALPSAKVDDLKAYCRAAGLTVGGNKAALLERVAAHLAPCEGGQEEANDRGQ